MRIVVTRKNSQPSTSINMVFTFLVAGALAYYFTPWKIQALLVTVVACVLALAKSVLFDGGVGNSESGDLLIEIDDAGVYDRRLGVGKILWKDIQDVKLQVTEGYSYLCFEVPNPEPYLARLSLAKRQRVKLNRDLGFYGFNVDVSAVSMNPLDLKKLIDKRLQKVPS